MRFKPALQLRLCIVTGASPADFGNPIMQAQRGVAFGLVIGVTGGMGTRAKQGKKKDQSMFHTQYVPRPEMLCNNQRAGLWRGSVYRIAKDHAGGRDVRDHATR